MMMNALDGLKWVNKIDEWPLLRRWVRRPPAWQRSRTAAAQTLAKNSFEPLDGWPLPTIRPGIFHASIPRVWCFDGDMETLVYNRTSDRVSVSHRGHRSQSLECREVYSAVEIDLTDVEGIAFSKSAERYFPSIDAFGQDFAAYKQVQMSVVGLGKLLSHYEIRILGERPSDSLFVDLWDGRIFLCNSGGSHHFAAAAFLARRLGVHVPIRARLTVRGIDAEEVQRLLETTVPMAVGPGFTAECRHAATRLLGSCSFIRPWPRVDHANTLVMLPRHASDARNVEAMLVGNGARPLGPWLEGLLERQRQEALHLATKLILPVGRP